LPSSSPDVQQQIQPGNVKLFGQSFLFQSWLHCSPQSALHPLAIGVIDWVPMQQPLSPSSWAPSATRLKACGRDFQQADRNAWEWHCIYVLHRDPKPSLIAPVW
jgi:hypothetical protein